MSIYEDLKVGDKIVIDNGWRRYRFTQVSRVTKTRITIDSGEQFNRHNGIRIGDNESWHPTTIATVWPDGRLMSLDEARIKIEEQNNQQERNRLIKGIINSTNYKNLDLDQLKEIAKILGIEVKQ